MSTFYYFRIKEIIILFIFLMFVQPKAKNYPIVFPLPQEAHYTGDSLCITNQMTIYLPENPSLSDSFLAQLLASELIDSYGLPLAIKKTKNISANNFGIVAGSLDNPLVNQLCTKYGYKHNIEQLKPEGYLLRVDKDGILIAGRDEAGAFYGVQSLRQLIFLNQNSIFCHHTLITDWPLLPFRGIRLMLPGPENLTFFNRFLKNFMALFKFNKVIIELNSNVRLKKHPELNEGAVEFYEDLVYTRRDRPQGPYGEYQNSAHHDAGDGTIVEQEDVRSLVVFAQKHYIEVIPEIPCLTHSYYLLTKHRELAEIKAAEWPDTYCPSNPKSYELLFDVFDELIGLINPKIIHIGHDEWRMALNVCPLCKSKDYREIFIEDFNRIYQYLTARNIQVAMWADHLLESIRNKGSRPGFVPETKYTYQRPGALTPQQVEERIPKDVLLFNWCWNEKSNRPDREIPNRGIHNDIQLDRWGFKQVYGNFTPAISNYKDRLALKGLIGGAPSAWMATTPFNFGKDVIDDFLGCSNLLWSTHPIQPVERQDMISKIMPRIRFYLTGKKMPSQSKNPIRTVDLKEYVNTSLNQVLHHNRTNESHELIHFNHLSFRLVNPVSKNGEKNIIAVGVRGKNNPIYPIVGPMLKLGNDVSSLIFLQGCLKAAQNNRSTRMIHNYEDTADLLGWYEIKYEDGFIETIPIRYGVNIKETNSDNKFCYQADAIVLNKKSESSPTIFYAYEWKNPRFGKIIESVQLKGTSGFQDYMGNIIEDNTILLVALTIVEKRDINKSAAGLN
jgi:hypothetical protein